MHSECLSRLNVFLLDQFVCIDIEICVNIIQSYEARSLEPVHLIHKPFPIVVETG